MASFHSIEFKQSILTDDNLTSVCKSNLPPGMAKVVLRAAPSAALVTLVPLADSPMVEPQPEA